jgi:hypothetical protein
MIDIQISINLKHPIASLQAVRIEPVMRDPKDGEICTYELYTDRKDKNYIGQLEHPYGSALSLSIAMLEFYQKHKDQ